MVVIFDQFNWKVYYPLISKLNLWVLICFTEHHNHRQNLVQSQNRSSEVKVRSDTTDSLHSSTHCDAGAKPRARLRASSTDVVAHSRVLAAGSVQVSHRPWTVSTRETSGPWRVGACIQTQRGAEQLRNTQQRSVQFLLATTQRDTFEPKEHITGFICSSQRTC